jgi:hypothetical protein
MTAETQALLDRQIDDLLLDARGLALVRDLLVKRGATDDEIASHTRALARTRARLAELLRGPGSAPEPKHRDRDQVRDACDGREPRVRRAVVAAGHLDDERDDDRADQREAGDRGRVNVDLTEPLVPAVAA